MKKNGFVCVMVLMVMVLVGLAEAAPVTGSKSGMINDCAIIGRNTIDTTSASSVVSANKSCEAGLDATYDTINPDTLQTQSKRKYGSGQYGYSASFTATTGYRSVKIRTSFSARYGTGTWSDSLTTVR